MSSPTIEEIVKLKKSLGDDERYHGEFDDLLEEKLMKLDPEWMKTMRAIYKKSGMSRWCA